METSRFAAGPAGLCSCDLRFCRTMGGWQAPNHFYPCLSIHSVTMSINKCTYIHHESMIYHVFQLWTVKNGRSPLKNVWLQGQSNKVWGCSLFFWASISALMFNATAAWRSRRMFEGNFKLEMLKLQEPPFKWNDAILYYSTYDQRPDRNLHILSSD